MIPPVSSSSPFLQAHATGDLRARRFIPPGPMDDSVRTYVPIDDLRKGECLGAAAPTHAVHATENQLVDKTVLSSFAEFFSRVFQVPDGVDDLERTAFRNCEVHGEEVRLDVEGNVDTTSIPSAAPDSESTAGDVFHALPS